MDIPCPPAHLRPLFREIGVCMFPDCPRYSLPPDTLKALERAPESGQVQTASKQKAAPGLYRGDAQMAAKHPAEHGKEVKKITGSQSGAGMTQIQPISQWPGFARERVDWHGGRDLEHDRPVGWQPDSFADLKFSPPQPNTVPRNKNQMLPDFPGPFVLEQSNIGNSQADTFTDFAPGENVASSRQPHLRKLPSVPAKNAFCTGEDASWSSGNSRKNQSEVEFTPESTPEQEDFHAISAPAEPLEVQDQANSAHHNLSYAPDKPVYKFVPFRNVPRIIDEGTSEDYQRWLEVSNRLGWSGSARHDTSTIEGKHRPGSRPVRNDDKTNSSGSGPVRRDAMTFATGDLRKKIEKVARYVARSGPKFEEVVRSKNQGTDIVSFLEPTNTYHTYYKWRVAQCKAGNTYDFESEETAAETDPWTEHINSDGRQHWYNKVSHEFVWEKPLALVARFQPRKEIGQGIEKRELDFLGDCVKFLPFDVRSKAIAVVDKLQNIAYGALSDELPAEKEDDATQKLQKVEAALKLIQSKHTDTESALLKRIEELDNKQTPQMPEATATKLNTLYDKLGHIVDQGVQQLGSDRKSDKDQETIVSKLQQRIENLENKQASQMSDDTVDRLGTFKLEVLETHSALLKNIQGVDRDMHSRTSELAATQGRICEEVGDVVNERMKDFRDERTLIDGGHKEIVSALLKRIEDLEEKQSSEIPEPITSRLHEFSNKLEHVDGRLTKFESVQEAIDTKNSDTLTELWQRMVEHGKEFQSERESFVKHLETTEALQKRIENVETKQSSHDLDAVGAQLQDVISSRDAVRAQIAKLEAQQKEQFAEMNKETAKLRLEAMEFHLDTTKALQAAEKVKVQDDKVRLQADKARLEADMTRFEAEKNGQNAGIKTGPEAPRPPPKLAGTVRGRDLRAQPRGNPNRPTYARSAPTITPLPLTAIDIPEPPSMPPDLLCLNKVPTPATGIKPAAGGGW